jgi:hypothetical protein
VYKEARKLAVHHKLFYLLCKWKVTNWFRLPPYL